MKIMKEKELKYSVVGMSRFAHISDVHLGAMTGKLREVNIQCFVDSLDIALNRNVDFIIISGDLFENTLPDISSVRKGISKMKEIKDNGINIYAIPGSHDYSINNSSIFDLLESAGLFENVFKFKYDNDRLILKPTIDKKTNVAIYGISARKLGLEEDYFKYLGGYDDYDSFKIFLFHSAVTEIAIDTKYFGKDIPVSLFPKNMNYYAGGHIHKKIVKNIEGMKFFYPGPIFGADFNDLENYANGEERGFFIVEFDDDVKNYEFIKNEKYIPLLIDIDVNNKDSLTAYKEIIEKIEEYDVYNKIVLLKIHGELNSGKTTDINKMKIKDKILNAGGIDVRISFNVSVRKLEKYFENELSRDEIHKKVFSENINKLKFNENNLDGLNGISLAMDLINILSIEQGENESNIDYNNKIKKEAFKRLGINYDD